MKRLDQFATNCNGCGWLKQGEFLDGMPYLACMRHGIIMHEQSDDECKDWRSPLYVEKVFQKVREAEAKRLAQSRTKQRADNASYDDYNID